MDLPSSPAPDVPEGIDLPLVSIIPVRKRTVTKRGYEKLKANIQALGLIDPLCVCRDGSKYYLLDGYVRFQILLELGVEEAPCLVLDRRDFYTPNRQVANLSRNEEGKMIQRALAKVDEKTIARHFALRALRPKSHERDKDLHPDVAAAVASGEITRVCAREFTFVVPARQAELLEIMRQAGDKSPAFVKTQIIKTPPNQRVKRRVRGKSPWERDTRQKDALADRLSEVNRHYAFFNELHRTYSTDLMRLVMYVRELLEEPTLSDWIKTNEPSIYRLFQDSVTECMAPAPSRKSKGMKLGDTP